MAWGKLTLSPQICAFMPPNSWNTSCIAHWCIVAIGFRRLQTTSGYLSSGGVTGLISQWSGAYQKKKVKSIWMAAAHAMVWSIWLERIKRLFENTAAEDNSKQHSSMRLLGLGKKNVNNTSSLITILFVYKDLEKPHTVNLFH